ncbi:MAG: FAD-dependent oxidoreductase [Alphaproteobacteria bacterium]|nr:FAD-dependent oxidoreductase [Alphaproteobacteria bacterium]
MSSYHEPARQTPIRENADVLVVGGGSAGLCAAVAAARAGARVVLAESHGFLGGTLTAVTLGSICGLYTVTEDDIVPAVGGLLSEIIERLAILEGPRAPTRWLETATMIYDPFLLRVVADNLVSETDMSLALHTRAVSVIMDGSRIDGVVFEGQDGRWACRARMVIDCTGDCTVAALAGAKFEMDADGIQFPNPMFRLGGVDTDKVEAMKRPELRQHLEQAVAAGFDLPRTAGGLFVIHPGAVHLNVTRVARDGLPPNTLETEDVTWAEIEGRRQVMLYRDAFRAHVPGFENCYVDDCGARIGVRETRRITGQYSLSVDEVMGEARFDDAIACCSWPLEEHGAGRATRWVWLRPGGYYQIPFRSLVPIEIEGLLTAGRCVSASHEAQASLRVAAPCMAMGQAAGTAAAMAADGQVKVTDLDSADLQARLLQQGAIIHERETEIA